MCILHTDSVGIAVVSPTLSTVVCIVAQCTFRKTEDRTALQATWGNAAQCRANQQLGQARAAFKAQGLQPFIAPTFMNPRYAPLLGKWSFVSRLHGDPLHLVKSRN
jgi:hypothetical protein